MYPALKMYVQGNWFQFAPAVAYQVDDEGNNSPLNWLPTYEIENGQGLIRFQFDSYDTNKPLIVQIGGLPLAGAEVEDPRNMNWCTYAGSNRGDEFMATDVDDNGDSYATGYAYAANFPVGTGFQVIPPDNDQFAGSEDVVTMKFDHDTKQIIWATYQGGSGEPTGASDEWRGLDKAYDMAVYRGNDSNLAYAFVTGSTMCPDFYTYEEPDSPFDGAAEPTYGGGPGGEQGAFLLAYTQDEGKLHWSTTMGPDNDIWWADGLGVDVFDDGTLFWVGRTSGSFNSNPIPGYPYVSPSGAFTNVNGGGFFALFDSDFQYEWNTLFGTQCSVSGIFDVKLGRKEGNGPRKALITGVTCAGGLDVINPVGNTGFYQPTHGGGQTDAFFAMLDLDLYQLDYSTYWGGNGDDYGIAVDVEFVSPNGAMRAWVGGMTKSTNLTTAQLPLPTGLPTDVLHQAGNAGEADGMLLNWELAGLPGLEYGTLYGGAGHDAILDVEVGKRPGNFTANQIYVVGESRSASHIVLVDNATLFQQPLLGNTAGATQRDGFLLALDHFAYTPIWTTYIGGLNSDKCWGVASTTEELYVVGGTISDQGTFPLKEFDTTVPQDWYDGDIFNNTADGGSGEYSFLNMRFNSMFGASSAFDPWPNHSFDGFIASFGASPALSVVEVSGHEALIPQLIDPDGVWRISTTDDSRWLTVHDAAGRIVQVRNIPVHSATQQVDLRELAPGVYTVTLSTSGGRPFYCKLNRP